MSSATTARTSLDLRYRTIDLVTITTLGVAFGVIFWGWGKLYEPVSSGATIAYPPSAGLFGGVWLMAGVVGGLIVRKPGAAFATEFIAATVSVFIVGGTQWGFSVFASGFWEGLGAELVFLVFFYKRWGLPVAMLAGALAGAFESIYEWGSYYPDWEISYRLVHAGCFALAGAVVAGLGGWLLVQALARAGVLDAFPVGREQVPRSRREVRMVRGEVRFEGFTWRPLGRRLPVVVGLDLLIEPGERVLLVGPSGAGKSTLLHALVGALGSTIAGELSGSATVDGQPGLLLQNPADAIVAERIGRDVAFGPENARMARDEIWRRVDDALDAVGLTGYGRDHFTAALSGGEQQRLALAGVLALRPDVLLLDEPTSMLDAATAAEVRAAIVRAAEGRTLVVVEHRIEPWLPHVDRVVALSTEGQIVGDGSVANFLAGPAPTGVWMPGLAAPEPLAVPAHLVRPSAEAMTVVARRVDVELVLRTLRGPQRTAALTGFDAVIEPGCTTGFTGPSGAGKSTALAVMGGLIRPRDGVVEPDLSRWRSARLAAAVGWVPQNPEHGFLTTTVAEEVGRSAAVVDREVDVSAVLEVFGLARFAASHPYRLSGGEQRRLALAAALAHRPAVVLLDEPTVGQDPDTWAAVAGWIGASRSAGATVGVATHDADLPLDVEQVMS